MTRRKSRRRSETDAAPIKPPLVQLRNPYSPLEVLSEQDLDAIHDGSMRILEEIGLEVLNERAIDLYEADGARVDREPDRGRQETGKR